MRGPLRVVGPAVLAAVWLAADSGRPRAAEPRPEGEASSGGVSAEYAAHCTALLIAGFDGTKGGLRTAELHYRAAQRLRPEDARLTYTYGLVLLKNLKHTEALAQFREAAEAITPSLPAARALIRESIRRKQYDEAVTELTALAEQIGHANGPVADAEDRAATSRWMGLALGFLTGPHMTESVLESATKAEAAILGRLAAADREHYDLGKQDVLVIEGQLELEQQSAAASAELKQQAEEQQSAARREAYQARQEELLDSKEQWDAWFADTARALDTQLDQLGDRFDTLNRSVTSLIESIQAAQLDLKRLQTIAEYRARQRQGSDGSAALPAGGALEAQLLARSQELNVYVNELSAAMAQRDLTARQAKGVLAQRAAAEQKYRDATGTVAKQVSRVRQWDARLKTAMEQAKHTPASSRKLRSLANRAQSFVTYDPFDLDAEQQRLLRVYDKPVN